MAAHETEYLTAEGNDYPEHEKTYERFMLMALVGTGHVVSTTIALAVGGVKGSWWLAIGIILAATAVAVHGIATGAKTPTYVMVALALVILALA